MLRSCAAITLVLAVAFYIHARVTKALRWCRGSPSYLDKIENVIRMQMMTGRDGAMLRLENWESGRGFVDMIKRWPDDEPCHFVLAVSERACSGNEFEKVPQMLGNHGYAGAIEMCDGEKRLVVDCGRDIEMATRITRLLFMSLWGAPANAKLRRRLKGVFVSIGVMKHADWENPRGVRK